MADDGHDRGDAAAALSIFLGIRGRLFGIAYRMLGSSTEADDIVQEAWLRWSGADHATVRDPAAFLAVTTTRLAMNAAQAAYRRRETYPGPWLPEPVDTSTDPALGAERGEALEFAVLLMLEKLPPKERAAYILREAFDYPYPTIAETLEVTDGYARQLVTRARTHLTQGRRTPVEPAQQQRLLDAFVAAASSGDLRQLERLLAADVIAYADGGGVVGAARRPIFGADRVARFMTGIRVGLGLTRPLASREINGRPAVLVSHYSGALGLLTIDASAEGIDRVMIVLNPAKLAAITDPA